jgi:hypothetical protein
MATTTLRPHGPPARDDLRDPQDEDGKFQTSVRFSHDARELLRRLARELRISKTAVMEMAIRRLHREEVERISYRR